MVATWATSAVPADAWRLRVSAKLLSVYDAPAASRSSAVTSARFNAKGWVQADVHYDCSNGSRSVIATRLSVSSSVRLASYCVVEGWVAPETLSQLAAVAGVERVSLPSYAIVPKLKAAGTAAAPARYTINHNGATIMHAGEFFDQTGITGTGAKVGVQSGGISNVQVIQQRGELPTVQVVLPADGAAAPAGDEGTALLEEIYAVAPGASLAYCGPATYVEYTSCLSQMVAAGATILVDDIIFPQQDLLSSDSSEVQAVEQLLTQNPAVVLFTAAGNYNGSYWEGNYSPVALSSLGLPPLTCGTQTDNYVAQFDGDPNELLTMTQAANVPLAFSWADPPNQNSSQFDVIWVNTDTGAQGCLSASTATDNLISQSVSFNGSTFKLYVATPDATSAGKFLKLWIGGDGLTSLSKSTTGSVVTPQAFATGVVTVGAVNGSDAVGNKIEAFSSLGPATLTFPDKKQIQAPTLVAPDGVNVDATGTDFAGSLFPDGNFYGTSAAAPQAAAVAALIRAGYPSMSAAQLVDVLTKGATPLGSVIPDGTFGFGRVDAIGALNVAISVAGNPAPPPTNTTPPPATQPAPPASGGGGGGGGAINVWTLAALLLVLASRRVSMRAIPWVLSAILMSTAALAAPPIDKAKIDAALSGVINSNALVGVSALVYQDGHEAYFGAFGQADREAGRPMSRDTLVQIFSMTKPVTGVALMSLYEEGKFNLDDPLSKYAPEFTNMKVYAGIDPHGEVIYEPVHRPITVRDITRHTAGFYYGNDHSPVGEIYRAADPSNKRNTLVEEAHLLGSVPLMFQPGTQWRYGPSVDVQALLVERLSGMPFDKYLQKKIFAPLGMKSTRYVLQPKDKERLAAVYDWHPDGSLTRVPDQDAFDFNSKDWPLKPGSFGLVSTLDDYMRFARMLQNGGELDGKRILKAQTIKLMATDQLPPDVVDKGFLPSKGQVGFGIDFAVRIRPPADAQEASGAVGEFFWDGAKDTLFWVDPQNKITAVLFTQYAPFGKVPLHKAFRDAVYSGIPEALAH
jgi:CubicO group peptidase (beta-lactamase class C family)